MGLLNAFQSGCGPMASDVVEDVAGVGRGQHGGAAPLLRSPLGGHRGLGAGEPGRGPAGRLRNPGGLRPVAGRGRPRRRTPRIDRHRSGAGHPVAPRDGPVESGSTFVPGRAPSGLQRTVAHRYRSSHGRRRSPSILPLPSILPISMRWARTPCRIRSPGSGESRHGGHHRLGPLGSGRCGSPRSRPPVAGANGPAPGLSSVPGARSCPLPGAGRHPRGQHPTGRWSGNPFRCTKPGPPSRNGAMGPGR